MSVLSLVARGAEGPKGPPASLEYQVKAAFLYNFAKFVDWPADKAQSGPFVVCVLGTDPFGAALDQALLKKVIGGRPTQVWRIHGLGEARQCQILFVSSSEEARLGSILRALRDDSVLTVGEMDDFAERGGMIHLKTEASKVQLEINVEAAARARIQISSKLLRLARVVSAKGQAGQN